MPLKSFWMDFKCQDHNASSLITLEDTGITKVRVVFKVGILFSKLKKKKEKKI